ncbi:hypothetical protein C0Q70_04037 [Pomacea canaliculata]|uniref:Uncharacterized protein n=1 Tax=Pomacea canaliculata TaxID=400727 RepID=A0A2T7PUD6_POMCA|nr:ankyrin repeat domain-containing protein 49-like isoform X1 [Pomacea canaliculata]PVD37044.1 hypothetical protein C0Q70_04037 [Pomacea canaliculata]
MAGVPDPQDVDIEDGQELEEDTLNSDILKQILEAKDGMPSKFQSFWERDEQDVDEFTKEEIENEPPKRILWAAENNHLSIVQQLLAMDPSLVNARDRDQYTPLHRAAYGDHVEIAELLLLNNADINARTIDGWQPLHSACRWNCARTAELLLQNGAQVNAQSNGGLTPLHLACSEPENAEVVELLLMWPGIDVNLVSHSGQTAEQIASSSSVLEHLFQVVHPSVNQLYPTP